MISYNSVNNNISPPVRRPECITLGRLAPDFAALSTQGYIRLSDYKGKWVLLASNPSAFGAVSTTEIIALAQGYQDLQNKNVEVIGLTTDNLYANLAWVYEIYQETGITVPFPIIADADLVISEQYGMLNPDRLYGETVRDSFIINPYGRIRSILSLPISCGRNTEELLRVIDSLQITEKYNLYTPANWQPGNPLLLPAPSTYDELINRVNTAEDSGVTCPSWYVCYTNVPSSTTAGNSPTAPENNVDSQDFKIWGI